MSDFNINSFIEKHNHKGMVLGLDNIKKILDYLGNPQDGLKVIHIAGTNGKGSVGTFLTSILSHGGYVVGRFVSPAVVMYNEIIQFSYVDSNCGFIVDYIDNDDLDRYFNVIHKAELEVLGNNQCLTMFEAETVAAFMAFVDRKCDIVILETGLGGRLDATNVVDGTICEVLTTISYDHMHILGDTLDKIAEEKCGIIKNNSVVVSAPQDDTVRRIIEQYAIKNNSELHFIKEDDIEYKCFLPDKTEFVFEGNEYMNRLIGKHQIINASVAIKTVKQLNNRGFLIDENSIHSGLSVSEWKGRMSIVSKDPLIIVDGAHNEDAALRLKECLSLYFTDYKFIFVVGAFADKATDRIMEIMAPMAECIYTFQTNNVRALDSHILARQGENYCKEVVALNDANEALFNAIEKINSINVDKKAIICFGSLSFVSDIYRYFD